MSGLDKRKKIDMFSSRATKKCTKKKNGRARRAKVLFFIVKYANL